MSKPAVAIFPVTNPIANPQVQHYDHTPQNGETIHYHVPSPSSATPLIPYGNSPAGTMSIQILGTCSASSRNTVTTIEINYSIPDGIQMTPFHSNPGIPYPGTDRIAYLPNNTEGHMLLTRYKVAFLYGYMFKIGRSHASGLDNQVTWSTIPNKTSLHGSGPFGFPDPHYFTVANIALDSIGIPSANGCLSVLNFLQSYQQQQSTNHQHHNYLHSIIPIPAPSAPPGNSNTAAASAPLAVVASSHNTFIGDESIPYTAPSVNNVSVVTDLLPLSEEDIYNVLSSSQLCSICLEPLISRSTTRHGQAQSSGGNKFGIRKHIFPLFGGNSNLHRLTQAFECKKIGICNHIFHQHCIAGLVRHQETKCPICRQPMGRLQGKSPCGTMQIKLNVNQPCPGFPNAVGTYRITYTIPSGKQKSYHDQPGLPYTGTTRVAYMPNTIEGCDLLQRLKYAWKHGLIFRIGTSLTTGVQNQVTWTSIHHKTNLNFQSSAFGPHAFPDDNYISNCNASLDALHVPPADQCL